MNTIRQYGEPAFSARAGATQITCGALRAETVIKNCSIFIRLNSAGGGEEQTNNKGR